ncbi:MAG TPA: hypothetical protein VMV72_06710 [Verrucomicrobiae bacterium]|nr:hypothetical protein [Verrucomicrobiae bacterium]
MHSILLIAEMPQALSEREQPSWIYQLKTIEANALQDAGGDASLEKLNAGCWLLSANGGLSILASLIRGLEHSKMKYRVLFFEEPPKWIGSPQKTQP